MTTITEEVFFSDFPIDMTNFFPPLSPGFDWEWGWDELEDNEVTTRDTTGWTAEMDLRETAGGQLIQKLSSANGAITNDSSGHFVVKSLGSANANISARSLITNVKVKDNTGATSNHFKGTIPVEVIVTR